MKEEISCLEQCFRTTVSGMNRKDAVYWGLMRVGIKMQKGWAGSPAFVC